MALFPPVVASSMPAFNIEQKYVKIYFTVSDYNQLDDIHSVHISIRRQDSNVSIIKNNSEMLIKDFDKTTQDQLSKYYIIIQDSDLEQGNKFEVDTLYKVQLRFSSVLVDDSEFSAKFFTDNIKKFSEWSTVCLIKPIVAPIFYIDEFHYDKEDDKGQKEEAEDNLINSFADFVGVYKPEQSSETLKSWRLKLYNNTKTLLKDSGWNLVSSYNYTLDSSALIFKCSLPYQFIAGESYILNLAIETKNGFTDDKDYSFISSAYSSVTDEFRLNRTNAPPQVLVNEEQGYVKLHFTFVEQQIHNIALRRSDSAHDFLNWTDLKIFQGKDQQHFIYYDFTVESGTLYKYIVQQIDERGRYTYHDFITSEHPVVVEWEHAFLLQLADDRIVSSEDLANNDLNVKQLKLKYDFQISSYKTNITQNLTTTIGSKYPFIRRNGNNYYKSFPITGTISYYMDNVNFFTSFEKLLGVEGKRNLENYYQDTMTNKYTYQRKFREEVEKFLYNNKPKLYKSTQEGNLLIKLMEVSLTPKTELDRLIYTFSGTAYEIGQASIQNLNYYNFISIGLIDPTPEWDQPVIGQISSYKSDEQPYGNIFKAGEDIIGGNLETASQFSIAKKYHYKQSIDGVVLEDFYLNYLRLTLESQPYLIFQTTSGQYKIYEGQNMYDFGPDILTSLYRLHSTYGDIKNVYLGYLFEINKQPIIISSNGIYELKSDDLKLSSSTTIIPKKDCKINLDYGIYKTYVTDLSLVPTRITMFKKVGQLMGAYSSNIDLIKEIKGKYNLTFYHINSDTLIKERTVQNIERVPSIKIEAEPRTRISIKTSSMTSPQDFIMNETGVLDITFDTKSEDIKSLNVFPPEGDISGRPVDIMVFYIVEMKRSYYNVL